MISSFFKSNSLFFEYMTDEWIKRSIYIEFGAFIHSFMVIINVIHHSFVYKSDWWWISCSWLKIIIKIDYHYYYYVMYSRNTHTHTHRYINIEDNDDDNHDNSTTCKLSVFCLVISFSIVFCKYTHTMLPIPVCLIWFWFHWQNNDDKEFFLLEIFIWNSMKEFLTVLMTMMMIDWNNNMTVCNWVEKNSLWFISIYA